MQPYYEAKGITIYHADCRDVLPALRANSVACVLTDPPYGIRYVSREVKKGRFGFGEPIANDDSLNIVRDVMPDLVRVLRDDSHAFLFSAPTMLGQSIDAVEQFLQVKDLLVWDKGNQGSRGDCLAGFSRNWESIIHGAKGRRPLNRPRPKTVIRYDWSSSRVKRHPTEKPTGLMKIILAKATKPGDLVVDPFMGCGPVVEAAAALGLRVIAMEVEEAHCASAVARLMEKAA